MAQPKSKLTIKLLNLEEVDFTNPEQKIKSPRSLNIISSLGLKPKDLYQISLQEFLNKNPDLKKLGKEIQNQRYKLYDEERQNNINRCIQQRQELILLTKKNKNKNKEKQENNNKTALSDSEADNYGSTTKSNINRRTMNNSSIKLINEKDKKIYMTENSYIMKDKNGFSSEITKDQLYKIPCLKNKKNIFDKKCESNEERMLKYLKSEILKEKKIQSVKNKINKKQKKISNFLKLRDEGLKIVENGRYQDQMDKYKRQELYEKMLSNYDKKIYVTKAQQQEKIRSKTLNTEKIEELNEQIKNYEKKNQVYKKKIENIFYLKEKQDIEEKKIKEKKFDINKPDLGIRKLADLEQILEMERFRRENVLMNNVNNLQNKINNILEKKEEKEKKIKKRKELEEKKREEKLMMNNLKFEEVRNNVKLNQKKQQEKRELILKNLEQKDLKDFAIKQEKIKMYEERKKMNLQNHENREMLKNKLKDMLKENQIDNIEKEDIILNKLLNN